MITAEEAIDRKKLIKRGQRLFVIVGKELNLLSTRTNANYRRKEDHEEICIALALLAEVTGMSVEEGR